MMHDHTNCPACRLAAAPSAEEPYDAGGGRVQPIACPRCLSRGVQCRHPFVASAEEPRTAAWFEHDMTKCGCDGPTRIDPSCPILKRGRPAEEPRPPDPIVACQAWCRQYVKDRGAKLTPNEYYIAQAAFIAAHPGQGPTSEVSAPLAAHGPLIERLETLLKAIEFYPGKSWPNASDVEITLLQDVHQRRHSPWAGGTLAASKLIADAPKLLREAVAALSGPPSGHQEGT